MDSKILPLNLEVDFQTECWNRQIIAMALTNKDNYAWYIERFNDYKFNEALNYQYFYIRSIEHGFFADFGEVLEYELLLFVNDIINFIRNKINENFYISVFAESTGFTNRVEEHEFLIVGYDKDNVYFYNYFHGNNFIDKMDNNEFIERYEKEKSLMTVESVMTKQQQLLLPLCVFKVKKMKREVNLSNLIYALEDILFDKKEIHTGKFGKANFYHSLSTCNVVSKFLNKDRDKDDIFKVVKILQKYFETRKELQNKINFLNIYDFDKELLSFRKNITVVKNLISKYSLTKEIFIKCKIQKLLREIKIADSNCLTKIKTKLEKNFKKMYADEINIMIKGY